MKEVPLDKVLLGDSLGSEMTCPVEPRFLSLFLQGALNAQDSLLSSSLPHIKSVQSRNARESVLTSNFTITHGCTLSKNYRPEQ